MNVTNIVQLGRPPLPPIKKKNNNRQTATLTQTNLNKPVSYECKDSFPYLCFQQPYQTSNNKEQSAITNNSNRNHNFNENLPSAFQFNSNYFENTPPRNFLKPTRHKSDQQTNLSPLLNTVNLNSSKHSYTHSNNILNSPVPKPWSTNNSQLTPQLLKTNDLCHSPQTLFASPSNLKRKRDIEVSYDVFSQLNEIIERKVQKQIRKNLKKCSTCEMIGHTNANDYRCEFNKVNLAKRRKNVSYLNFD